jgi:hypothetical protein
VRANRTFPRNPKNGSQGSNDLERALSVNWDRLLAGEERYKAAILQATQEQGEFTRFEGRQMKRVPASAGTPLPDGDASPPLKEEDEERLIRNCLLITDLGVVEDCERTACLGQWTFGALMTNLANEKATGIKPAEFVRRWLAHWEADQTINGCRARPRPRVKEMITDLWPRVAGTDEMDLARAPFRLLAIVNRVDLRNNLLLGAERIGGGGAGEARFVFCATDPSFHDVPRPFLVIFEYAIKKNDFEAVYDWARQWYDLRKLKPGSPEYNEALDTITAQFIDADTDPESPPNHSALSQIRTNEGLKLQAGENWECREFRLDTQNEGYLRQVTVKQTPDLTLHGPSKEPVLTDFIKGHEADILAQRVAPPLVLPNGKPFLAASALIEGGMFWGKFTPKAASLNPEARHLFSLGTCSGCHGGETGTDFTHIDGRAKGQEAKLSGFLKGKDPNNKPFVVQDPAGQKGPDGNVVTREFNDLHRRALDLRDLVEFPHTELHRLPLQSTH